METAKREKARRAEQAYQTIRRWILEGRWQPGDVVSTYALSEQLNMSRTPIHEALSRLEQEGLVEILPQIGCRIVHLSSEEVAEVFSIRAVLEGLAAEMAASRATEADLKELERILEEAQRAAEQGDGEAYERLNRAFHFKVVAASDMPRLYKLLENLWALGRYQLVSVPFLKSRAPVSLKEHRAVLEALKTRDPQGARRALEEHLRRCSVEFSTSLRQKEVYSTSPGRR